MSTVSGPSIGRHWVLHDYMQVNGGAERLVSTIARGLPGFSLGVSAVYPEYRNSADTSGIDLKILGRFPRWLPRIPKALLTFGRPIFMPEEVDTVIYSGVYAPLAVRRQHRGRSIFYCHTPPRFAFDRKAEYLANLPRWLRPLISAAITAYRQAYTDAVRRMDVVLTNSQHVRQRLSEQLSVEAQVVYPPVDVKAFKWAAQGDYYLSLGRLEPNKRVDRVVKAFLQMPDKKLVVASGGSQMQALRALAGKASNIIFKGWSSDEELINLIAHALACIYIPQDEDFGMSAIESMAAGKPVIGVAEGGMLETVVNGQTGILLPPNPNADHIVAAVHDLGADKASIMRDHCQQRALIFNEGCFLDQIRSFISPTA